MGIAGLIVAAPASGSGKTTLTLALLASLTRRGIAVVPAKTGPDYIDPAFHRAASGKICRNLDSWAMAPGTLAGLFEAMASDGDWVLCEGVMGLFDGAAVDRRPQPGSTAALAALTGWPVLLVVDGRGQGESAGALLRGFANYAPGVTLGGVIFNWVKSSRHEHLLRAAAAHGVPDVPVIGCLPRNPALTLPARHLGLVPAGEHPDLAHLLDQAADLVDNHLDFSQLRAMAGGLASVDPQGPQRPALPPLGQRIAVARDEAFAFCYESVLDGWRDCGAEISFFSPLADEAPGHDRDAVYLPGGYPELHGGRLAGNQGFLTGLREMAARGAAVWGECGGYMVLGEGFVDGDGVAHEMAGLLPVKTSFAKPRLHLGYRQAVVAKDCPLGPAGTRFRGHEFHYASLLSPVGGDGEDLFHLTNAGGESLGPAGHVRGRIAGSFLHLIDREDGANDRR
ncbi:MAG: cobyrinate a,c-diamide synthase [Alphaproteobacteria bacterium]